MFTEKFRETLRKVLCLIGGVFCGIVIGAVTKVVIEVAGVLFLGMTGFLAVHEAEPVAEKMITGQWDWGASIAVIVGAISGLMIWCAFLNNEDRDGTAPIQHPWRIACLIVIALSLAYLHVLMAIGDNRPQQRKAFSQDWDTLNRQALNHMRLGHYIEVIRLSRQAVRLAETTFGPEDQRVAASSELLAEAHKRIHRKSPDSITP